MAVSFSVSAMIAGMSERVLFSRFGSSKGGIALGGRKRARRGSKKQSLESTIRETGTPSEAGQKNSPKRFTLDPMQTFKVD